MIETFAIVAVYAAVVIFIGMVTIMLADAFDANELISKWGLIVVCVGFLGLFVALVGTVTVQVTS